MFQRFQKHKLWRNLITLEHTEVKVAFFLSIGLILLFLRLDIFHHFALFKEALQSTMGGFIGGYIALLGFSLSAVAMVAGLFSKEDIDKIEENAPGRLENTLASFEYLGLVTAITIVLLAVAYLLMEIEWPFHMILFYLTAFVALYFTLFTMFYTLSLVGHCIQLYYLKLEVERDTEGTTKP